MMKGGISTVGNIENFFRTSSFLTEGVEKIGENLKTAAMNLSRLFKEKRFPYCSETIKL